MAVTVAVAAAKKELESTAESREEPALEQGETKARVGLHDVLRTPPIPCSCYYYAHRKATPRRVAAEEDGGRPPSLDREREHLND